MIVSFQTSYSLYTYLFLQQFINDSRFGIMRIFRHNNTYQYTQIQ